MDEQTPWIRKYRPQRLADVVGQGTPAERLAARVAAKRPALIAGASGTGKTAAVHALAAEKGYELIELNASDVRDRETIEKVIRTAFEQRSLFMREKLLLIDELEGVSGTKDRGGIPAIAALVKGRHVPLVLITQDQWDRRLSTLRRSCEVIPFNSLSYLSIANILERISAAEHLPATKDQLKTIARRAGGDARAAINDLQLLSTGPITDAAIDSLTQRDRTEKLADAMLRVFKTTDISIAASAFDNVDEDYEKVMLLVAENLPKEYGKDDLARAFDAVSRADVFAGRIRRRQHWRYLVYIFFLLSAGVALAKKEKYRKFVPYANTAERVRMLFSSRGAREERDSIAEALAPLLHCSKREITQSVLPYLAVIARRRPEMLAGLSLSEGDMAFLSRQKEAEVTGESR